MTPDIPDEIVVTKGFQDNTNEIGPGVHTQTLPAGFTFTHELK